MDIVFLKEKIKEKFSRQEDFASKLGVSLRTLQDWFSKKSVPSEILFKMLDLLDLGKEEEDRLLNIPKVQLFFRTLSKKIPSERSISLCEGLASSFLKLTPHEYRVQYSLPILQNPSFNNAISVIRSVLSLKDDMPAKLASSLETLQSKGPKVVIFPFNKIGVEIGHPEREVAFSAFKGDKRIVFLDSNRRSDELLFDLIHELGHIVCGHTDPISYQDEEFCNKIAEEIIYPRVFFLNNEKMVSFFQGCSQISNIRIKETLHTLVKDFDWSVMGIALALKEYGLLVPQDNSYKKLMLLDKQMKNRTKTIDDLFFSALKSNDYAELVQFFEKDIYKNKDIFNAFLDLKNSATYGHLSSSRLAELIDINAGDADELVRAWIEADRNEEDQEGAVKN